MAKRALVVGINNYPAPNELASSVRDAEAFAGTLESIHRFEHVRLMRDGEATRDAVDRALEWLVGGAGTNDRLVFYFSGHGARYEKSGVVEEALVLQDGKFLEDHDLAARFEALPPGVLTVVIDASFAGAIDELMLLPSGDVEVAKVKRWIPPDADRLRHDREMLGRARAFSPFGFAKPAPGPTIVTHFKRWDPSTARIAPLADPRAKTLIVTACLEDEVACASTSQTNGLSAFTCCLLHSMRRLGPNRSTIEVLQAAGHELGRLGFRQTPLVKEPSDPEHLGLRSFLAFQPVLFVYSSSTPGTETEENLQRSIAEAVRNTLERQKEGQPMQTMTGPGQSFVGEDIGAIVSTVTPIVASLLQSRSYQPYLGPQQLGFGFGGLGYGQQSGLGFQSQQGLHPQEIAHIVSTVTPIVLSQLQSRSFLGGSPYGSWGGYPPQQHQPQHGWGGQQWGSGGFGQMGFMPQMGAMIHPQEIAQIVGTVTPIVASLLQSRGFQSQNLGMPRAA